LVQVFNSDEELAEMIKKYSPDVMVVGSDWEGKKIIGGEYAKEIKYFKRIKGFSTTKILTNGKSK
jgi:bifunctional ADP-heptose synthase (sugar kinase/adenylyltransferase)